MKEKKKKKTRGGEVRKRPERTQRPTPSTNDDSDDTGYKTDPPIGNLIPDNQSGEECVGVLLRCHFRADSAPAQEGRQADKEDLQTAPLRVPD